MRWVGVLLVGVVLSGCGSLSGAAPFAPLHATASPLASPATPSPSPSASPGETNVYAATRSGFAPAVQGLPPHVYVPNEGSNSVSIIDPTTYKVIGRIAVGSAPQHVTPSWDLRTLYVNDTALTAIDPRSEKATNVVQVAMPSLVAAWEPRSVGRATAAYGNGMLVGEIAGAALTATIVITLVGGSWQAALALWSVPVLAVAVALFFQPEAPAPLERPLWWPQWRDGRVWLIGLALGAASLAYWGSNAHLPDYLNATGHGDDVPLALTSLNLLQLPSSFLVALVPAAFVARRWPFVAAGIVTVVGALGLIATNGAASPAWTGAMGMMSALVFVLALALPPLMAAPGDVHRFSAAVFTISYACAFVGPLLAGALWDATRIPAMALIPIALAGVALIALGSRMRLR